MRWHPTRIAFLLLAATTCMAAPDGPVDRGASLADQIRAAVRRELLTAIPPNRRIIVHPHQPVKHRVTVFTDTDCPYCRKLHQQIQDYLRAGIEVQYVFYPRSGPDSPAYARAVAVWCSEDREAALAAALNGDPIPSRTCDNPVAEHYDLAIRLGLLGTPALIMEDGSVMYGAVAAPKLLDRLDALAATRQ